MIIGYHHFYNIVLVGAGGTGGYVVAQLARLIYSLSSTRRKSIDLVIVDGDRVEPKNLLRQQFIERDLYKNKAQVLAERYSKAFQIPIRYCDEYLTSVEQLERIFSDLGNAYNILVGCVDNNKARQIMHQYFESVDYLAYIDAGNEEFDGQVVMGLKERGKVILPPIGTVYPDVLEPEEEKPVSCADVVEENPQNIMANYFSAAIVLAFLNNILAVGELNTELNTQMATFNCKNIIIRPTYCPE